MVGTLSHFGRFVVWYRTTTRAESIALVLFLEQRGMQADFDVPNKYGIRHI